MGATLTEDIFSNDSSAYKFNGMSDYIELNNNQPIIKNGTFTIAFGLGWTAWAGVGMNKTLLLNNEVIAPLQATRQLKYFPIMVQIIFILLYAMASIVLVQL